MSQQFPTWKSYKHVIVASFVLRADHNDFQIIGGWAINSEPTWKTDRQSDRHPFYIELAASPRRGGVSVASRLQ